MVPKPIGDNGQKQSLTTALRNCCRDYPAGSGVLRELLQNADDAGSTFVRFHLDENTHPSDDLLHPALAAYQGPALLVYSNAAFTEKDWKSLSQLGDSLKALDSSKTGKHGRGFNSIYSWTDSPAIASNNRLLILDPHYRLGGTSGPVYDFVRDRADTCIKNQMAAFLSVLDDDAGAFQSPFQGTIIRVPLRTAEQAIHSEIVQRAASVTEIREVLKAFVNEFGDSGLLFLRHISTISITSTTDVSISIGVKDSKGTTKYKEAINEALKTADHDPDFSFDLSYETKISHISGQQSKESCFIVHHTICARSTVASPSPSREPAWVAVAAKYPYDEGFCGSLFTVLPLSIGSLQPIHVHLIGSLSPDRARLLKVNKDNSQDQSDGRWNEWLLDNAVPKAWTKLLCFMAHQHPDDPSFKWWPHITANGILDSALNKVVDIVAEGSLPVWSTCVGHVTAMEGLLNVGEKSRSLQDSLNEARVPVVYVPSRLQSNAEQVFRSRILDARSLSVFLKDNSLPIRDLSLSSKKAILEFLMSDPEFLEYGSLELFPFKDGKYRAIDDHDAFFHRNESEMKLFELQKAYSLDLDMVSPSTVQRLRQKGAKLHPSIRQRTDLDFKNFCVEFHFSQTLEDQTKNQDVVVWEPATAAFISRAWPWIIENRIDVSRALSDLWLISLRNGQHRRVKPRQGGAEVIFDFPGALGNFMRALSDTGLSSLSTEAKNYLLMSPSRPDLSIRDGANFVDFVHWLSRVRHQVNSATEKVKDELTQILSSNLHPNLTSSTTKEFVEAIGHLEIFKKLTWNVNNQATTILVDTSIKAAGVSVLVHDIIAVPCIPGVQFLYAEHHSARSKLLNDLKVAESLTTLKIIQTYIIPQWTSTDVMQMPYLYKVELAKLVLKHYSSLGPGYQHQTRTLPIVPVARLDGHLASKFAVPSDLVDSRSSLAALFFKNEEAYPDAKFLQDFRAVLFDIGLTHTIDEVLLLKRIRCFAGTTQTDLEIVRACVLKMLQHPCPRRSSENADFRQLKWLPVEHDGVWSLESPAKCRPKEDRYLAGSQMCIFSTSPSVAWQEMFGWNEPLAKSVLLDQLQWGLRATNDTERRKVVDQVLAYIDTNSRSSNSDDYSNDFIAKLADIPCFVTSKGEYVTASKVYQPYILGGANCDALDPYLRNIGSSFWKEHQTLLSKLTILKCPNPKALVEVQKALESKLPLIESDLKVAAQLLDLAARFTMEQLHDMKFLTQDGKFCEIQEICYNDLGVLAPSGVSNLMHSCYDIRIAKKLGLECLTARRMKQNLKLLDIEDEEEFEQQEDIVTRILDSLERYPIESTFKEYLANAADAEGTTTVNWLLDGRDHHHANDCLLTPELESVQGPALLVHNDGVFSEADIKGFREVGQGSKSQNKAAIGQFGRGSQSMFNISDQPMLLTGKDLIILDPQKKVLLKKKYTGERMSGVKLSLSSMKVACPDQLAPFEGLWGYTRDMDEYTGTIFRFPLRQKSFESRLNNPNIELDVEAVRQKLMEYFDEARVSLLFLKNITSLDFKVYGSDDYGWSISKECTPHNPFSLSQSLKCTFSLNKLHDKPITDGVDEWFVAIEDLEQKTDDFKFSPRRVMKNIECGIAGLVSSKPVADIMPRFFNTLPLPGSSGLPVFVHATFFLSGDRRSIIIDDQGSEIDHSKWNKYLLQDALPDLYLKFLEEAAHPLTIGVFEKFWPREDLSKRSNSGVLLSSFWEKLAGSSCRLFAKAQMLGSAPIPGQRKAPTLYTVNEGVFDFMPKTRSDSLNGLLLSLGVKLVQQLPAFTSNRLRDFPLKEGTLQTVDGNRLRALLKLKTNGLKFETEIAEVKRSSVAKSTRLIEHVLTMVLPFDEAKDLDGCYVIPLANGTVAPLRLQDSSTTTITYFYATKAEHDIFSFASPLLISLAAGKRFEKVIESKRFNVQELKAHHIDQILALRTFPLAIDNPTDDWLITFWAYWDVASKLSSEPLEFDFAGPAVFRASFQGKDNYLNFSDFKFLPAVVTPENEDHLKVCNQFPEIRLFHRNFMPKSLRYAENSLHDSASFFRFLKSVKTIATQEGRSLGDCFSNHLTSIQLSCVRGLLANLTQYQNDQEKVILDGLKNDLRSIPLWPSVDITSKTLIPATRALTTKTPAFLVPWMRDHRLFIDPKMAGKLSNETCLKFLGIQRVSTHTLLSKYLLPIPKVTAGNEEFYRGLIIAISKFAESGDNLHDVKAALSDSKVALDGRGELHRPKELYNHSEPIFAAAFRGLEDTKFLHPKIQDMLTFWLKLGIRSQLRGRLDAEDYIHCLDQLGKKLRSGPKNISSENFKEDVRTVLSPLIVESSATQGFTDNSWNIIADKKVFPGREAFIWEPAHRQTRMESIAGQHPVLSLVEIVSYNEEQVAVCWSQVPFSAHAPTTRALDFSRNRGRPSVAVVWKHLEYLAAIAKTQIRSNHVREYLLDLHRTYAYLQDNSESSRSFVLRGKAVWLNLDIAAGQEACLIDVQSNWVEIDNLVLSSSCDKGRVKAVRQSLMQYDKLLRRVGCNSIIYPKVPRPPISAGRDTLAEVRALRAQGKMLDVTFHSEHKQIRAHRLMIAAVSKKFATQWSSQGFTVEKDIKYDEDEGDLLFISFQTLSTMIDYAYDSNIDWTAMEAIESDDQATRKHKLSRLLDLHGGANQWIVPSLMADVETKMIFGAQFLLNIVDVEELKERAESVNAKAFKEMCELFIKQNQGTLNQA